MAMQEPLPSQTTPPLSVHAVPLGAGSLPQRWLLHVLVLQTVPVGAQSFAALHCTQVPAPSQIVPPLSLQAVVSGAFAVPQVLASHVADLHAVDGAGQSLAATHPTQAPLPSHTLPPLVVHASPEALLVVPQQPPSHVAETQSLVGVGQSAAARQDFAPPEHIWPVLVLEVVSEVDVVVDVVAPPPPPAPPVPLILPRSTDAMSSHPITDAASAPAARKKAVMELIVLVMLTSSS
jgi:hypothetical protein